jgi:Ni/Co efflux regulator RcnB
MKKHAAALLVAAIAAFAIVAAPTAASAAFGGGQAKANKKLCKSGTYVNNLKNCKENGGKK